MPAYPADPTDAGRRLFRRWLGARHARAVSLRDWASDGPLGSGSLEIGRQWSVGLTVVDTLAPDATLPWEGARAALESRLDGAGCNFAVFVPRGASLPAGDPGAGEFVESALQPVPAPDGRLEIRRDVNVYIRRTALGGSVVTALGGLSAEWARFTNRVPGTFQVQSLELFRLPGDEEERDALFERIVLAAGQPGVDDSVSVPATDAWTAVDLEDGGSCVIGTPLPENDQWSAALRRNLRRLLAEARDRRPPGDISALAILGAATYAGDERLSWTLRGMDPSLYAGYDIITVIADGVVRPVLEPPEADLPWGL